MRLLRRLTSLVRNVFGSGHADRDLDEELRSYVEQLTQEKIAAGLSAEKARRQAQIELGGIEQVKERVRDIRPGAWLDSLLHDLRYAARSSSSPERVSCFAP
jgi:hypothetical protein